MASTVSTPHFPRFLPRRSASSSFVKTQLRSTGRMASDKSTRAAPPPSASSTPPTTVGTFDSHLHVWASPQEALGNYPYHPGHEPTLPGHVDFLLECMAEAQVDGALIVQPVNHMFDHSYVTNVLKMYPSKFIGCCLANPAENGIGIAHLEQLILKDGYRAVRFNPYLWPSSQKMTNKIGRSLFAKAGELGVPVGIMCMKGLSLHVAEIEELCLTLPSTTVVLDHMGFSKPEANGKGNNDFSELLKLSRFPQIYVKFSALFRLSKNPFPYEDMSSLLAQVITSYGANRVMWGTDFPFVVPECGYKGAKEAASIIAGSIPLSSSDLEWIMGKTALQLFQAS